MQLHRPPPPPPSLTVRCGVVGVWRADGSVAAVWCPSAGTPSSAPRPQRLTESNRSPGTIPIERQEHYVCDHRFLYQTGDRGVHPTFHSPPVIRSPSASASTAPSTRPSPRSCTPPRQPTQGSHDLCLKVDSFLCLFASHVLDTGFCCSPFDCENVD